MRISSNFDSGSIDVVSMQADGTIDLKLRRDSHADIWQWFHFRLQGAAGKRVQLRFTNCGSSTYPDGWIGYRPMMSYDRRNWFRTEGYYADGVLTVPLTPQHDSLYLAYFEPYSWERHLDLLARADSNRHAKVIDLGTTVEGRDLNAIVAGNAKRGHPPVWVIARQHPGETMAEWFIEGLLDRLLDNDDAIAKALLAEAQFVIVPNMNPDGSVGGNLRTNAAGANLNREWSTPSMESSPEVYLVREHLQKTGCRLFLDIHGDENLPYVFADGLSGVPDLPAAVLRKERQFCADLLSASDDFQTEFGYAPDKFSNELLKLANKWVGHHCGCVALVLEMPFKDNAAKPDERAGWSSARSKALGAAILQPIRNALA